MAINTYDPKSFRRLPYKALTHVEEVDDEVCICSFKNIMTGEEKSEALPVTLGQIKQWVTGELIQNAMPNLTTDERELFLTGGLDFENI